MSTINLTIDGVACTCEHGEFLYDVAKRNGIDIPVLCRSDAFDDHRACCRICIVEVEIRGRTKIVTSCVYPVEQRNGIDIPVLCRSDAFDDHRACCRICIVEVEIRGRTKIVTSCVYPVEQDCIVRTNTERIREERAVVMALLIKRAPDSEKMQTMAKKLGAEAGFDRLVTLDTNTERIREERAVVMALLIKRAPDSEKMQTMAKKLGAEAGFDRLVTLDGEKCILCGLCVQACDSLGTGAISTVDRGTEKRVDTPYSDPSLDCIGCLSCANVCPTDAISYTQTDTERTIWNRTFRLVRCPSCGRMMGTEEAVAAAAEKAHLETPQLCDECRKKAIADSMARTYRYV